MIPNTDIIPELFPEVNIKFANNYYNACKCICHSLFKEVLKCTIIYWPVEQMYIYSSIKGFIKGSFLNPHL